MTCSNCDSLAAKVERLTARGIEDMQAEIERLCRGISACCVGWTGTNEERDAIVYALLRLLHND